MSGMNGNWSAKRCLVVTPASNYGSWTWLEDMFRNSGSDISWRVITYGNPALTLPNVEIIALPGGEYIKLGRFMSRRGLRWLNILYSFPLGLICFFQVLRFRPQAILCNGFASSAFPSVVGRLTSTKVVVAFHSHTGALGEAWRRIIKWFSYVCDLVIVNSKGSEDDLRDLVESRKLRVVGHWADKVFFDQPIGDEMTHHPINILYVGRLDSEKCLQFVRVMSTLSDGKLFKATVVGSGELEDRVRNLVGVDWYPYIEGRNEMAILMSQSTLVWAPADTTYLSRPGIEALATGIPVVVTDIPALGSKIGTNERVPKELLPTGIGWVVDGDDDREVIDLFWKVWGLGIPVSQREACRSFAAAHHGTQIVDSLVDAIFEKS